LANINLHIYPSNMLYASRIYKESRFISKNFNFEKIILFGIWEEGLKKYELFEKNVYIKRVSLLSIRNRIIMYLYYYFYIIVFIIFKRPKMINIHTLEFLPLSILTKIFKIKIIYDTHELETEKVNFNSVRKKISKIIERNFINLVDIVFVVSDSIANWYEKEYKIPRPVVVKNAPKFFEPIRNNHFRNDLGIKKGSKIALYQGGLSKGRGIDLLLECFKKREDDKVVMVFMGYGELEDEIKSLARIKDNIFFYPAVDSDIVLEYTSSADFGISMIENTCLNEEYCLPNKLFEYIMAGLPVIVSNMKEMREFIEYYNIGVVANYKIESVNKAIEQVLALDIEQMKKNLRKCAKENAWEIQEEILTKTYKKFK